MRLEATGKEDQHKVWLTDADLEELRRAAGGHRDDLVIQLGGFVGLRAFEIPQVAPKTRQTHGRARGRRDRRRRLPPRVESRSPAPVRAAPPRR